MQKYVVLVVDDDEDGWETLTPEDRQRTYDADAGFIRLLEERGGKVVGGAELDHSRSGRWLGRDGAGQVVVTDGPFAETVEQLSGFYLVEVPDLDTLTDCVREMLPAHHRIELRARPTDEAEEADA